MKKLFAIILALILVFAVYDICSDFISIIKGESLIEKSPEPTVSLPAETHAPIIPTETPAPVIPAETPAPLHSPLYIQGLSPEDVILYFNEVCLDSEFINSGDPSFVQKWTAPICYRVYGDCTDEDRYVLDNFVAFLNSIEGFPGMYEGDSTETANMRIYFCGPDRMAEIFPSMNTYGMDGAVTFWYDGQNSIYDADICVLSDIDQYTRNSVLQEEIYNGLGPIQDTSLRPDSIIYQEYAQIQELSEVDALLLKLLYSEEILCGMDSVQCENVIRSLYY